MKKIFIYPTDTVWGIGGDPFKLETYQLISDIKKTSIEKPLSILTNDVQNLIDVFKGSQNLAQLFEDLFKFQITVGLPKAALKLDLPHEAFSKTDFICFRVIQNDIIDECISDFPRFITSTSLNISGEEPISDLELAKSFWQKYCPESTFISSDFLELSGTSSTIVFISGLSAQIIREGEDLDNILETLRGHGFNI